MEAKTVNELIDVQQDLNQKLIICKEQIQKFLDYKKRFDLNNCKYVRRNYYKSKGFNEEQINEREEHYIMKNDVIYSIRKLFKGK